MYQPNSAGKPGFHSVVDSHMQHPATKAPVSSMLYRNDIEEQQQDQCKHGEHQAPIKKGILGSQHRLSGWQMLAVTLIMVVAVGMIAGFHLSVPVILSEQLHLKNSLRQAFDNSSASDFTQSKTQLPVHNTPQMLFDDAAKVAIETSKRRFAAAMAEK